MTPQISNISKQEETTIVTTTSKNQLSLEFVDWWQFQYSAPLGVCRLVAISIFITFIILVTNLENNPLRGGQVEESVGVESVIGCQDFGCGSIDLIVASGIFS